MCLSYGRVRAFDGFSAAVCNADDDGARVDHERAHVHGARAVVRLFLRERGTRRGRRVSHHPAAGRRHTPRSGRLRRQDLRRVRAAPLAARRSVVPRSDSRDAHSAHHGDAPWDGRRAIRRPPTLARTARTRRRAGGQWVATAATVHPTELIASTVGRRAKTLHVPPRGAVVWQTQPDTTIAQWRRLAISDLRFRGCPRV